MQHWRHALFRWHKEYGLHPVQKGEAKGETRVKKRAKAEEKAALGDRGGPTTLCARLEPALLART